MDSLFPEDASQKKAAPAPLAERMRPRTFDEFVGQQELLAPGKPLREAIERDLLQSIILWGPPGTGKTTLARIVADLTQARFVSFSAVLSGIKEIREVMAEAERTRRTTGRRTIVFIDEIHRFNKAQQDAFLPRVEAGDIVLIGATTENPSFEVNAALLSRSKVFVLRGLTAAEIEVILRRALADPERGLGAERIAIDEAAISAMALHANGDARAALNLLELSAAAAPSADGARAIDVDRVQQAIQRRALLYDKGGEEHYNIISALHKSMRNSDPDASVYWLARMIEAGEDPLYIARRLVRFASEDVGNADPQALTVAVAAKDGGQYGPRPGRDLSGHGAEEQCDLHRVQCRRRGRAPRRRAAGAAAPAQRAHAVDEVAQLREGLQVRAQRGRRDSRHVVPAAGARRQDVLRADRSRR
jgi:putative ATPase